MIDFLADLDRRQVGFRSLNDLHTVTDDVVEAARSTLVIGAD